MIANSPTTPSPRSRRWIVILLVLILLIAAWFVHSRLGKRAMPNMDMATPVQASSAVTGDVPATLTSLGTVTANASVTVTSRIDGHLRAVYFTEGQYVEKGQLLAQIDTRAYQAELTQYQGTLVESQAQLTSARLTLERYQRLYAKDSLARQDLDTQQSAARQYEGAVQSAQGQIAAAQLNIDYGRITAPVAGYVGLRQVDPGNMVHASDTSGIVTITQTHPIAVKFSIPQANLKSVLGPLRQGQTLPVSTLEQQGAQVIATGKVMFISNEVDTTTGSVQLKALFENADDALYPNQFVNVRLQVGTLKDAVLVPAAAVQLSDSGKFVFIVGADNTVKRQAVTTGPTAEDGRVVISQGVKAGDRVVTQGIDSLSSGSKVKVVQAQKIDSNELENAPRRRMGPPPGR
ncbi:MdtA/MuxA family multidrug efflux RND transporter periplasmic adaptor subunit [Herbaspirillum sp. RV1423]|uniref:MdtA/MuxA family multidrug efflux RND transporter periplasmic adaptor subunit n=1 Tax=Herbaspirillum sp. RV1423 TaxID=1443993 RepID=UPI000559880D|nr:MdtA/MuxA family multidrug efflux RND transporter periplasmic adaptor subunit [Herbaspirillum sp. RV1423]